MARPRSVTKNVQGMQVIFVKEAPGWSASWISKVDGSERLVWSMGTIRDATDEVVADEIRRRGQGR